MEQNGKDDEKKDYTDYAGPRVHHRRKAKKGAAKKSSAKKSARKTVKRAHR